MRTCHWLGLTVLLGVLGVSLALTNPAHSQRPDKKRGPQAETMFERLARETKLSDEQVQKLFNALGPAIRDELTRGKQVAIPGLGNFRVVRVAEHKDIREGGRPVLVPAFNTIEFVGDAALADVANADTAVPVQEVPAFQYIPLPGQTPGQKVGRTHTPGQRVK